MKKFWIVILAFLILGGLFFWIFQFSKKDTPNPSLPYTAEKTQASLPENISNENVSDGNILNENMSNENVSKNQNQVEHIPAQEVELASFSTPLRSTANSRRNNIEITAKILDGTIIEPNETFSFNEVVGKPTSARGYEKADVLVDGETTQAIGGRKLPSQFNYI